MKSKRLAALVLLCLLAGCTVGPDYQRPAIDTPNAWRVETQEAENLAATDWWQQFDDQVLSDMIITALQNNKDLMIATARIDEYLGRFGYTRADLYPQIGGGAEYTRARITETSDNRPAPGYEITTDTYSLALNASWELDFWGRIRRSTEAARAQIIASAEGRQSVILTLVSNIANSYINLRVLDQQLQISENTVKSRGDSYRLFQERYANGIISDLELSQSRSLYDEAVARLPRLRKAIAIQENALSLLLGRNPGPIPRGKSIDALGLPAVVAGLPSDLLERRPDIRLAEQQLIAANAQIGVAKALYFPTISLTGGLGLASGSLSNLFKGDSTIWNVDAPITVPIFTAGKIAGTVQEAEAIQQQTLISYRQTIQNAFAEVDDALSSQQETRLQLAAQKRQVDSLQRYLDIARMRYDNGYTDYLSVLDAERSLFSAQLDYTQTHGDLFQSMVNLYKAMGGGWVTKAAEMADVPPVPPEPSVLPVLNKPRQ
ncbi:MAG: efflux transporter outer membrane subunit [Desulfopila sp.]